MTAGRGPENGGRAFTGTLREVSNLFPKGPDGQKIPSKGCPVEQSFANRSRDQFTAEETIVPVAGRGLLPIEGAIQPFPRLICGKTLGITLYRIEADLPELGKR